MRADRLLSAVLLLQAHGRMSGRVLAERLEVSMRTLHRDMEALSSAGVPVFALRGARGGWQLDEDWRTQVPGLEEAELRALLMAQPRVVGDGNLANAAERALAKLMASLPTALREKASSMRQRLFIDTTGWRGTTENLVMLPLVQTAVSNDRKLQIRYAKTRQESVNRVVDPLGLVAKGNAWYLVANGDAGLRTYRVSRIEQAKMLEDAVKRPPDFDLTTYWKTSTDKFRESWPRYETLLRLEPDAAKQMKGWRMSRDEGTTDSDGWVRLKASFDDEDQARFIVLGFASRVEVVEPARLRDLVVKELESALERAKRLEEAGAQRAHA